MSQRNETTYPHRLLHRLLPLAGLFLAALLALPAAAQATAPRPALGGDDLDGLLVALEREYRLGAIYQRAAAEPGAGEALATARREQGRRLDRLVALFRAHGLAVPENPWAGRVEPFAERGEACLAGFRGELAMSTLYGELGESAGREDLAAVYRAAGVTPDWLEALRDCALAGEARVARAR